LRDRALVEANLHPRLRSDPSVASHGHAPTITVTHVDVPSLEVKVVGGTSSPGKPLPWTRLRFGHGAWYSVLPIPVLRGVYPLRLRVREGGRVMGSDHWLLRVFALGTGSRPLFSTPEAVAAWWVRTVPIEGASSQSDAGRSRPAIFATHAASSKRPSRRRAPGLGTFPGHSRSDRTWFAFVGAAREDPARREEVAAMARTAEAAERRDALVERLFANAIGAFDLFSVYLGDVLGLYRTLADSGPLTSAELAATAGLDERYAREWLEQQAGSGLLEAAEEGDVRRFRLPAGHDEALLEASSLNYVAPMARAVLASVRPIDKVLEAFRTGGGVPYADYGDDLHEAQAAFTRPLFENLLGKEWLPAMAEIHERLVVDPPGRIADVACGQGRSSIAMAHAYPKVRVDGIDSDPASIERARENLAGSGVEDRVTFHHRDAADAGLAGRYDLVTIFEALHDMSYPVDVLRAARSLLAEDGLLFIGDERTEEAFVAPAGDVERLFYGFSIFHCLPVGMVGEGAAGTGTVIRADDVRRYADGAGFSTCEVLPIENDFWRFYLLRP
jgi:2-polyprenyl-3-methyl-5-hydroxy-6-metoxy-1,4-benzoquinol methylase